MVRLMRISVNVNAVRPASKPGRILRGFAQGNLDPVPAALFGTVHGLVGAFDRGL